MLTSATSSTSSQPRLPSRAALAGLLNPSLVPGALNAGQLLREGAFAHRMKWTASALEAATRTSSVFFLEYKDKRYYPLFFTTDSPPFRLTEPVSRLLRGMPHTTKWLFFTSSRASLEGLSPLQALNEGKFKRVCEVAEAFAVNAVIRRGALLRRS